MLYYLSLIVYTCAFFSCKHLTANDEERVKLILDDYQNQLIAYFNQTEALAISEKDNSYGEHLAENKDKLKAAIQEANKLFSEMREQLQDVSRIHFKDRDSPDYFVSRIDSEAVSWYTSFIRVTFFPINWNKDYHRYLENGE